MFRILFEEKVITIVMLSLLGISIFTKVLLGWMYGALIKETDNMATTDNKLLKQCKMKFANCYQMGGRVPNISVYVDRFIARLKLGPFSLHTLYHFSGQTMLLSVVIAGIGICKGVSQGKNFAQVLPFYILSFWGLYIFLSISSAVDVNNKKVLLKLNLTDYLENHYLPRMDNSADSMDRLAQGKNVKKTVELLPIDKEERQVDKEELEALLQEFLAMEN